MLAFAGYPRGSAPISYKANSWFTYMITLDDFIASYTANGLYVNISKTFESFDFYLASVEFAQWDFFRGDADFIPTNDNKTELVSGSRTPVYVADATTVVPTSKALDNYINYKGSAVKYSIGTSGQFIELRFKYNQKELRNIANAGKFNAVKIYYMIDNNASDLSPNANSALLRYAEYNSAKWEVAMYTVDSFLSTFTSGDFDKTALINGFYIKDGSYDYYVGKVTFETWDFATKVLDKGAPTYTPDDITSRWASNDGSLIGEYVSNEDIMGLEGVKNDDGHKVKEPYFGTATKVADLSASGAYVVLEMPYTKDEYEILRNTEGSPVYGATHVKMTYMRHLHSGSYNNNQEQAILHDRIPASNTWYTRYIPWEDFIAAFKWADADATSSSYHDDKLYIVQHFRNSAGSYDIYLGNIEFTVGEWPETVVDKGYLGLDTSSDAVLSKTSFTGSAETKESFVPANDEWKAMGYDGNAVLINALINAKNFYLQLPYTGAEYDALVDAGYITTMTVTYMVIKGTNTTFSIQTGQSYWSIISKTSAPKRTNEWITHEVDLTQFDLATIDMGSGKFRLVAIQGSAATDVYFGGLSFS